MARQITFKITDASVVSTGSTYTIADEKDFDFLLETLSNFRNNTYDDATVEFTLYTTNTVLSGVIADRFADLD